MTNRFHYLVRYGRPGYVGRYASDLALARGDRVVVRGPRGVECAEVLLSPEYSPDAAEGEIVRATDSTDDAEMGQRCLLGAAVLDRAESRAAELGLPVTFVDAEVTLDGIAIVHAIPWGDCDATGLLEELGAESGLTVRLLDLSRAPTAKDPAETGCGKPGCGSESGGGGCSSGGCSTGSCSRGAVKSPEDLTAYFADLRQKMESAGLVRTPLN